MARRIANREQYRLVLAPRFREIPVALTLAGSIVLTALLVPRIDPIPAEVIAFGRRIATNAGKAKILEVVEGRNSSAVISQWEDGAMQIDVFSLLTEARQRIAASIASIEAQRDFWLADVDLRSAVIGGARADGAGDASPAAETPSASSGGD